MSDKKVAFIMHRKEYHIHNTLYTYYKSLASSLCGTRHSSLATFAFQVYNNVREIHGTALVMIAYNYYTTNDLIFQFVNVIIVLNVDLLTN